MEFAYTPRLAGLRRQAQDLAAVIVKYEDECEQDNGLGPDAHHAIREAVLAAGLQAINVPVQWGGAGLTVLEQVVVQDSLGSLTNALWDTVWRPANPLLACTPPQREKYLIPAARGERRDAVAITEETAGSDPSAVRTSAVRDGDGYRITGNKWFVTVGDVADFLIVLAVAEPGNAPTLFLVDRDAPGVSIVRTPRYTHTFVYEHPEFAFDNVRVGPDAVLGDVGQGYELTRGWFTEERLMIAARTIGAAERALTLASDWSARRLQGGEPLINRQLIRGMIADSVLDIAVSRTFTHQVAWDFDQGGDRKTLHARAAVAKLAASEASNRVADRAVQIFGGRGYMRDNPVERIWRELRVDRIWEGTSEIQRLIIANEVAKRGLQGLLDFTARGLAMPASWSGQVAIVGAYESARRRAPGMHPFAIQAECARGALSDAGLELADVDGLATAASFPAEGAREMAVAEVAEYLGIHPRWVDGTDIGGAAPISHAGHAVAAIQAGLADVVLVTYAACGYSWPHGAADYLTYSHGPGQWELPYGPSTVATYALAARRHMHDYGTTAEDLAAIAVQCRANAAANPDARYSAPISVDDVLASPVIASPLHRLDCCVVTDSGGAFVLTSARRAQSITARPAYVLGFGEALGQVSMSQMWPFTATAAAASGARAFQTAGMRPTEIDCAQLYDSFTITVLLALEDLGFCAKGEGGKFASAGELAPGGQLPINTDGGGLSSNHPGRRGALAVVEAVRQLRGTSPGLRLDRPRTALVHGMGGSLSTSATLILGV